KKNRLSPHCHPLSKSSSESDFAIKKQVNKSSRNSFDNVETLCPIKKCALSFVWPRFEFSTFLFLATRIS
ncbi:hypothetical protein M8C21_003462, partial [Ambrosia artemisiifolia]